MQLIKHKAGAALAMVLLGVLLIVGLGLTLQQMLLNQQRMANSLADYDLALNYARLALIDAERTVHEFDSKHKFEELSFDERTNKVKLLLGDIDNCKTSGINRGWCNDKRSLYDNKNSKFNNFQPWLIKTNTEKNKPCQSYSQTKSGMLLLDNKRSAYSISYATGDANLCAQPRYILELINHSYFANINNGGLTNESGAITQANNAVALVYRKAPPKINPARLYRITVRAFGRSGDTRIMLQEYVAISLGKRNVAQQVIPLSRRILRN